VFGYRNRIVGSSTIDRNLKTRFWWIKIEALIPNVKTLPGGTLEKSRSMAE